MSDFLQKIAQKIVAYENDLGKCLVILPTRRSAANLRREIAKLLSKPAWLPEFLTLNEWADRITGLDSADPLSLKFTCYQAYVEVMQNDARDISDFFSWANTLIRDFNDLESQRVDRKSFFKNLTQYREIEHFSFLTSPLSEKQKRYQRFWNALPKIHERFNQSLLEQNLAYSGLNLRRAYELVSHPDYEFDNKLFVAGFNAFSKCESDILKLYQDRGHAEIFFDVDSYYLDQRENHAGHFIRRNIKNHLGTPIFNDVSMAEKEMEVEICEAAHHIDQATVISSLLNELNEEELKETALVLADESMLIPILDHLPKGFDKFNITMGIGLGDSLFSSWIEVLYEVLIQKRKSDNAFPVKQINSFLSHPFTSLLKPEMGQYDSMSYGFVSKAHLPELFKNSSDNFEKLAVEFWDSNAKERNNNLKNLLLSVAGKLAEQKNISISNLQSQKIISLIVRGLKHLEKFEKQELLSHTQHYRVLNQMLNDGSIDLLGEPHDRLQIMGILETRALTFKRIVVCGANEGTWPAKPNLESFFPFEIRNYHNLPGKKEREAIYAYNFYRLFSHAQKVQLVYHTDKGNFGGGEKSRYVLQMEYSLRHINPQLNLKHRFVELDMNRAKEIVYEIEKTPEIIERIREHLTKGISISSINTYLQDSLEWYYSYIAKIEAPKTEDMDPAVFGTWVHEVLENLFKPYVSKLIGESQIIEMEKQIEPLLKDAIPKEFKNEDWETGLNKIYKEIAQSQISNYLATVREQIKNGDKIECVGLEIKLKDTLIVPVAGREIEVNFTGFADKILRRNGELEIIDYKTGNAEGKDILNNQLTIEYLAKKPKAVQLLTYNRMAAKIYPDDKILSRIITLLAPKRDNITIEYYRDDSEKNEDFEAFLISVIQEMLDPLIPLEKNQKFEYQRFE